VVLFPYTQKELE
jgi:hypothetical protein